MRKLSESLSGMAGTFFGLSIVGYIGKMYSPAEFLVGGLLFLIFSFMFWFIAEDVANVFPEETPYDG